MDQEVLKIEIHYLIGDLFLSFLDRQMRLRKNNLRRRERRIKNPGSDDPALIHPYTEAYPVGWYGDRIGTASEM